VTVTVAMFASHMGQLEAFGWMFSRRRLSVGHGTMTGVGMSHTLLYTVKLETASC